MKPGSGPLLPQHSNSMKHHKPPCCLPGRLWAFLVEIAMISFILCLIGSVLVCAYLSVILNEARSWAYWTRLAGHRRASTCSQGFYVFSHWSMPVLVRLPGVVRRRPHRPPRPILPGKTVRAMFLKQKREGKQMDWLPRARSWAWRNYCTTD